MYTRRSLLSSLLMIVEIQCLGK